jgi:hypothetical protein
VLVAALPNVHCGKGPCGTLRLSADRTSGIAADGIDAAVATVEFQRSNSSPLNWQLVWTLDGAPYPVLGGTGQTGEFTWAVTVTSTVPGRRTLAAALRRGVDSPMFSGTPFAFGSPPEDDCRPPDPATIALEFVQ